MPETTQGSESVLDEVIVTAQKREEGLQNIGIVITAVNGDRFVDAQVRNLMDWHIIGVKGYDKEL